MIRPRLVVQRASAVLLLGAVLLCAPPASAYVRYRTGAGVPLAWPRSCVAVTAYPSNFADMSPDEVLAAVAGAAAAWSAAGPDGCTSLAIAAGASLAAPPEAAFDGRNSIVFRTDRWCSPADAPGTCSYDPEMLALTTLTFADDGGIRDGDIEVNAVSFAWGDLVLHPGAIAEYDLQDALAHELGHLIGLDHPCTFTTGSDTAPLDNNGDPAPACAGAPAALTEATMFPTVDPGEISKRTLAPDDQQAVCDIYPASGAPTVCPATPPAAGCAIAPARAPGATAWVTLMALLAVVRRRLVAKS